MSVKAYPPNPSIASGPVLLVANNIDFDRAQYLVYSNLGAVPGFIWHETLTAIELKTGRIIKSKHPDPGVAWV